MNQQTVTKEALPVPGVNLNELRQAIQDEYKVVAKNPAHGFHFHTEQPLTRITTDDLINDAEMVGAATEVEALANGANGLSF